MVQQTGPCVGYRNFADQISDLLVGLTKLEMRRKDEGDAHHQRGQRALTVGDRVYGISNMTGRLERFIYALFLSARLGGGRLSVGELRNARHSFIG